MMQGKSRQAKGLWNDRFTRRQKLAAAATVALAAGHFAPAAQAATYTWATSPADASWATPGNWGGVAPVGGDALVFDASSITALNNNLTAGLTIAGITFNAAAPAYTIAGNNFVLGGNLVNNSPNLQTFNVDMVNQAIDVAVSGVGDFALQRIQSSTTNRTL